MNPSTAQAEAMVAGLIGSGTTDAVLSPGSRSAPLALALAAAERADLIRLHVRIDERSAGFLALGLAKRSGRAVPVVTTSGTAVANLLPAVVEASSASVPLLVLSADRPPWLRGVGAPQTIDQLKVFGDYPRAFIEAPVAGTEPAARWGSLVGRAVLRATDPLDPGPVHVNLPFAEPLVPAEAVDRPTAVPVPSRAAGNRPAPELADVLAGGGLASVPERGLIIVGDPAPGYEPAAVAALSDACGWPIIAEPTAGLHSAAGWVPAGELVAGSANWLADHPPELVLTVGRVGLHRSVAALIRSAPHLIAVGNGARWPDPTSTARAVAAEVPVASGVSAGDSGWRSGWLAAGDRAAEQVDGLLSESADFTGMHVARQVWRSLDDAAQLFLAASWPIRQAQLTARRRTGVRVLANRGANGIDGLVSTAWGAALAHEGPTTALLGDLAFLHDGNGLLVPAGEAPPPVRYVVIDNDGGGIFSQLDQASPQFGADFERVFGTPHGLNLVGRSRLSGLPGRGSDNLAELTDALDQPAPRASVLVAAVADRSTEAALLRRIREAAAAAC